MTEFGHMRPALLGRLLLGGVKLGFGRGRLKYALTVLWEKLVGPGLVDVSYHGLKLRLMPWGNTIESKILFSSKLREKVELDEMAGALVAGGTFVDIGANIGYYALMAAKLGASNVYAFEPNPELAERCEINAGFNGFGGRLKVLDFALGAVAGKARLVIASHDLGGSSIVRDDLGDDFIEVDVKPLAQVVRSLKIRRIDVMKIDVEGMEDAILRPFFKAADVSLYPKMMIIEDSSKSHWGWDVVEWMLSNGYRIKSRSRGNLILSR